MPTIKGEGAKLYILDTSTGEYMRLGERPLDELKAQWARTQSFVIDNFVELFQSYIDAFDINIVFKFANRRYIRKQQIAAAVERGHNRPLRFNRRRVKLTEYWICSKCHKIWAHSHAEHPILKWRYIAALCWHCLIGNRDTAWEQRYYGSYE